MTRRILHILNNLGSGGVEGLLMNIYRVINRDKVQFDFLIRSDKDNRFLEEIKQLGGKVYVMPNFPRKAVQNFISTLKFFKRHPEYKIIHVHANSLIYTLPLIIAKFKHIPYRIIHSHSTNSYGGRLGRIVHNINKTFLKHWATDFFSCSTDAAKWMFPTDVTWKHITNGIDLNLFSFSSKSRNKVRNILNLKDELIIGHVGRFLPVKNHNFIIEVFYELTKLNYNCKLLLVGEGSIPENLYKKINNYNLKDKIIQTGVVSNVYEYMCAMDVFIFPSLYEGLGLSLIEAQANGLPCFISDTIPKAAIVNHNVYPISLNTSARKWAEKINTSTLRLTDSELNIQLLRHFDIHTTAKELTDFYLSE